ncbi:effector-associated domain 2-containing protein [Streptomyces sp. SAJ15]|uniref:effector-associated domain 2-containing protein n=1 Tax=Streptomyces sp. SAJ15 TaxID=2011095 RepID=UPI00118577EF|nr:hypothetical protein [Streptomyces sp. SAJ15]TVL93008.1 hypothetical protein CD790_07715 [Streptomyces sp. SAJ15]
MTTGLRIRAVLVGVEVCAEEPSWRADGAVGDVLDCARRLRAAGLEPEDVALLLSGSSEVEAAAGPEWGPSLRPAGRVTVHEALFDDPAVCRADALLLVWSGPALAQLDGRRRLLCADATAGAPHGLDPDTALAGRHPGLVPSAALRDWLAEIRRPPRATPAPGPAAAPYHHIAAFRRVIAAGAGSHRGPVLRPAAARRRRLVLALEAVPAMVDPTTRELVLGLLPAEIATGVPRSPATRTQLVDLLDVCALFPGGLDLLCEAIGAVDSGTPALDAFRRAAMAPD